MKAQITISGQINGNFTLKGAISGAEEVKKGSFNSFILVFKTKKEAKKALWEAYKSIRKEDPTDSGLRYSPGYALSYDASRAVLSTEI